MSTFVLLILGLIVFIHFNNRIKKLEDLASGNVKKISEQEKPGFDVSTQSAISNIPAEGLTEQVFLSEKQPDVIDTHPITEKKEDIAPLPPKVEAAVAKKIEDNKKKISEFNFGGKIYTMVGVVAMILGVGFFLRYAFENDLITETARVILGVLGGVLMIAIGWYTRKKYEKYGNILTGGGLGILYLSLFAAYNFYNILSQPVAFLAMGAVTVVGVFLSVSYNAKELAFFSQLGGFITPLILSSGVNDPHSLFIYILLLDLGLVAVGLYKQWRKLIISGFAGTIFVFLLWFMKFGYLDFAVTLTYSTLFYVVFLAMFIIFYFRKQKLTQDYDFLFLLLNSIVYFLFNYALFNQLYPDYKGLFVFLLGIIHFLLFFVLYDKKDKDQPLPQYLLGLSSAFLVISLPTMLDKPWVTIGWSSIGALFAYIGFRFGFIKVRFFSLAIFLIAFMRMLSIDSNLPGGAEPWLNERMLTFIVSLVLYAFTCYLFWANKDKLDQKLEKGAISLMLVLSALVFLFFPSLELSQFSNSIIMPAFWSAASCLGVYFSFKLKNMPLRFVSIISVVMAVFYLIISAGNPVELIRYVTLLNKPSISMIVTIAFICLFALLVEAFESDIKLKKYLKNSCIVSANYLAIQLISLEIIHSVDTYSFAIGADQYEQVAPDYQRFNNIKNALLSVVWSLYAIVTLVVGIIKRSSITRMMSIVIFGVVIFKVFLYDTANLKDFYRFISFISLGSILLITGFLYNKYKDRITEFMIAKEDK